MFLGQAGMFLSFQAGRSSATRSSATRSSTSDLTVISSNWAVLAKRDREETKVQKKNLRNTEAKTFFL